VGEEDEAGRDRRTAVDLAAQCVDQAFLYATQNLDSVGLPLAPRLAGYVRARLRGCEGEVARLLGERWRHLTADWTSAAGPRDREPAANGGAAPLPHHHGGGRGPH
jgi:hypothetical protein